MPRMDVAAEYISTLLAPPPPSSSLVLPSLRFLTGTAIYWTRKARDGFKFHPVGGGVHAKVANHTAYRVAGDTVE